MAVTKEALKASDKIKKATQYKIISTIEELDKLILACKQTGYCCFDFETNAERIYRDKFIPTILGISFQPGSSIIVPLAHFDSPFKGRWKRVLRKLGDKVFEDKEILKIGWNIKFDNQILQKYGIFPQGRLFDGMLAKYLLDEERPNDLKSMVTRYYPMYGGYQEDYPGCKLPWGEKPLEGLSQYCAIDTDMTFRLMLFFEKKLIENDLYNVFRSLYMPDSRTTTAMERNGMKLDTPFNDSLIIKYRDKLIDVDKKMRSIKRIKIFEKALREDKVNDYISSIQKEVDELYEEKNKKRKKGEELTTREISSLERKISSRENKITRITAGQFETKKEKDLVEKLNLNSQKQMVELFFNHPKGFNFKVVKYTLKDKKETDNPSTAEDVLIELRKKDKTGFIELLLEHRGLSTINSTFVLGIRDALCDDGRIHPRFLLHGTTTNRKSSQDPNFQNLPRKNTNPDIKRMMIPDVGKLFLMMDYSQAELRFLAHMAKEKTMLEWFRTGKDIHLASACKKYNADYDEILSILGDMLHPDFRMWTMRRKQAKTINFGIVYGQTAKKLSEGLSNPDEGVYVSEQEAQKFLDEFYKNFPRILKFQEKQQKFVKKHGYVKSVFGTKRRLPDVWSDKFTKHLEALRQAVNSPIQGAASLMASFAAVLIREDVLKGKLPYMGQNTTVHDSLVFEIDAKDITLETVYGMWDIARNPETRKYFGFSIDDVEMSMDFGVGRSYDEELPFIPGYDYTKLLKSDFTKESYVEDSVVKANKKILIKDFPIVFPGKFKSSINNKQNSQNYK